PAEEMSDEEVLAMPDAEYMNDKQLAFFRIKLQKLKEDILNSAGETTEHLREDTVIVPDPADRATIEEEHALELRTRDRERKLLKKIEQSIGRIDAGDYGYRDETAKPTDLDQPDSDRESSYSKQMLKEMIERKRRNDFVRKREFDMLRKMRRSEVMAGQDPAARPSFFQSSMPSKPDDRATTLKKIDEIEAQMSMQWWKTKHGDNSSRMGSTGSFQAVPPQPESPAPPAAARVATPPAGAVRSTAYTKTEPI